MLKIIKYIKVYLSIVYNNFKVRYLNIIYVKVNYPKLIIGRSLKLKMMSTSNFIAPSNQIYDYVNIEITNNGILNLKKAAWIGNSVSIYANQINIGKYSAIHAFGTLIGNVKIGDYVMIAKNVFLSSGIHHYSDFPHLPIKMQDVLYEKNNGTYNNGIIIDDDVWIGVNCVIMSGVRIGKGSVVGSNSVVTKDVLPYSVVGGTPAKNLKIRYDFKPPKLIRANNILDFPYFYSGFNIEKEPFIAKENALFLEARSEFSIALNIQSEKEIFLKIKSLDKRKIIYFNEEAYEIGTEFILLTCKIFPNGNYIYTFSMNNNIILDKLEFAIAEVYVN